MFGYENGKRLFTLGFGLNVLVVFLYLLMYTLEDLGIYYLDNMILWRAEILPFAVAGLGLLFMWIERREIIDFITGVCVGIVIFNLILSYIPIYLYNLDLYDFYNSRTIMILMGILSSLNIFALAFRARTFSPFLSLLLMLAFVFHSLFKTILLPIVDYERIAIYVWYIGSVVCSLLCFIEIRNEQ